MKASELKVGDVLNGLQRVIDTPIPSKDSVLTEFEGNPLSYWFHLQNLRTVHRDGKQIWPEVTE